MIPIIKVPWEGPPTPRNGALSMARIFLRLHENLGIILKTYSKQKEHETLIDNRISKSLNVKLFFW